MAVYKRTYKAYAGRLTPEWSRFTVLSRYGFASLFDSRPFTAYTILCCVPFLVGIAIVYILHTPSVQGLLNVQFGEQFSIDRRWFMAFLSIQAWMGFVLTAWGAPGMITKDFANHAVQLYLSRPLSRTEYLMGKASVLVTLLSATTWIPTLLLFFLHASLQGNGWLWKNLWLAGSIIVGGLLWIAVITLYSMALAVWVKWRIAATGLMFATFILLPGLGEAVDQILRDPLGQAAELSLRHRPDMGTSVPVQRRPDQVEPVQLDPTLVSVGVFAERVLHFHLAAKPPSEGTGG